jgi:hypothetical protein
LASLSKILLKKRARTVFEEAYQHFKNNEPELKEERLLILENWLKLE